MSQPTPEEILAELVAASDGLTEDQVKTFGLDALHFLWTVHDKGGKFFVQYPEHEEPHPFTVTVPGLIEERGGG